MKYIDAEKLIAEIEHIRQAMIDKGEQKDLYDAEIIRRAVISNCNDIITFIDSLQQEQPEIFDTVAFQKGVAEGRRLEREDVKSIIQSRIDEILGDAQPAPILRMELQELIKKIES